MRRRGFLSTDILTGLLIAGSLATGLAVTVTKWRRAADMLAHDRAATEAAQRTLLELQQHRPAPRFEDIKLTLRPLNDNWTQVTAVCAGRTVSIVGLLPKEVSP